MNENHSDIIVGSNTENEISDHAYESSKLINLNRFKIFTNIKEGNIINIKINN